MTIPTPDPALRSVVERLLHTRDPLSLRFTAQGGGVSSDIWRVDSPGGTVCAKRALPELKVAQTWRAPTRRNAEEARWLRFAATVAPDQVPRVIADDPDQGVLLLSWFEPATWRNWKTELFAGRIEAGVGAGLGTLLGRIHAASARAPDVRAGFANLDLFEALRIAPYFGTAAERNPGAAAALERISTRLRQRGTALVHGDVSPKNVLVCPGRPPVLLDAECATWGDPTFDVAFPICHLLLKAIHRPQHFDEYTATATAFFDAYQPLAGGLIEAPEPLIAALLLARIDGKSPVEYLEPLVAPRARDFAVQQLNHPADDLPSLIEAWRRQLYAE